MKLFEYYSQRQAQLNALAQKLGSDLSTVGVSQTSQEKESKEWIDRISRLGAAIKSAEAQLAKFETGADIEHIANEIRALTIDRRTSLGRLEITQLVAAETSSKVDALAVQLESVNSAIKNTAVQLKQAEEEETRIQNVITAVTVDPIASMPEVADSLLSGTVTNAIDRLNSKTGPEFMSLVVSRAQRFWEGKKDVMQHAATMQTAANPLHESLHGSGAKIENAKIEYESATSALLAFRSNANAVLECAGSRAQKILEGELLNPAQQARFNELLAEGDILADVLTPEAEYREAEHNLVLRRRQLEMVRTVVRAGDPDISETDLNTHADVAAILDGTDGLASLADMETTFNNAATAIGAQRYDEVRQREQDLANAEAALEQAIQQFLAENPEGDSDSDPSLSTNWSAVNAASTALENTLTTLQATPWYKLERLETAIPDGTWRDILSLLQSRRDLTALKDIVPANLVLGQTNAEDTLANAILEEEEQQQGSNILQLQIDQLNTTAELTSNRSDAFALSAVRGQG